MNKRIRELVKQATTVMVPTDGEFAGKEFHDFDKEKFAQLIVARVLDEVAERAYYSGDRAWSDELDRAWVELEFGFGLLAQAQQKGRSSK